MLKIIGKVLLFCLFIPFVASLLAVGSVILAGGMQLARILPFIVIALCIFGLVYWLRESLETSVVMFVLGWFCVSAIVTIVCALLGNGSMAGSAMYAVLWVTFPVFIPAVLLSFYGELSLSVMFCLWSVLCLMIAMILFLKKRNRLLVRMGLCIVLALSVGVGVIYYNRAEKRYAGHGFAYMNGFSSTDLTDYTVYAKDSKLASLAHDASVTIDMDYPVMDGAEACYPLYAAVAKAMYANIEQIEQDALHSDNQYTNGKYVSFTNSVRGFDRLVYEKDVDLFFGAKPSPDQLKTAAMEGIELEVIPIGKEGFVFFTQDDNEVSSLTREQLKEIYHGNITNWQEVGGKNQKIVAFQRPENSGSQTMMEYFMGDVSLKKPLAYERVSAMGGVVHEVAQYVNERGAIGYTFRYFLEGLNQEKGVKILGVDGVMPTVENIRNGSYPLVVNVYVIYRKDTENPNVGKVVDFLLSEEGQSLIEKTGYAPLD